MFVEWFALYMMYMQEIQTPQLCALIWIFFYAIELFMIDFPFRQLV